MHANSSPVAELVETIRSLSWTRIRLGHPVVIGKHFVPVSDPSVSQLSMLLWMLVEVFYSASSRCHRWGLRYEPSLQRNITGLERIDSGSVERQEKVRLRHIYVALERHPRRHEQQTSQAPTAR